MSTVTHKVILSVLISQIIRNFPHQNFRLFYQNLIIPQSLIPRRKWKKSKASETCAGFNYNDRILPRSIWEWDELIKGQTHFQLHGNARTRSITY